MIIKMFLAMSFVAVSLTGPPVWEQKNSPCRLRATQVKEVREYYEEKLIAQGKFFQDELFEIFASPYGRTWKLFFTTSNGKFSCLYMRGEKWKTEDFPSWLVLEDDRKIPVGRGITHDGSFLEILATKGGSSWIAFKTTPKGEKSIFAAGNGWRDIFPDIRFEWPDL